MSGTTVSNRRCAMNSGSTARERSLEADREEDQTKSAPPDYSIFGESPLGSCHQEGTFCSRKTTK